MNLGRTEVAIKIHLLGGPADGVTEDATIINTIEVPPIYNMQRNSGDALGNIVYVYHLIRIEHPPGEPPQVYYRYID